MQLNNFRLKPKTWLEISESGLIHNLRIFQKSLNKETKTMTVVKANAYGHGLEQVVPILDKASIDWFGVDNIEEALQIRKLGVKKPILVLGYVGLENIKYAIENDMSFVVYDLGICRKIVQLNAKKKAKVHIKVETGLNRQGLNENEVVKLAKYIKSNHKKMVLEGIYTHFANIEDTLDASFAMKQHNKFDKIVKKVKSIKKDVLVHCAASAATLLHKETHRDMVRLGISLYGLWPSKETQIAMSLKSESHLKFAPVLTWKSVIVQIKTIKIGESVGYGRIWFTPRKSTIGIIPVGYYDGYDRKLSNNSFVLVGKGLAPVIGRVAMNMIVVDLTDIKDVKRGDVAVLIGKTKRNTITAEELASRSGTINYEIVSRINPQLPRILV